MPNQTTLGIIQKYILLATGAPGSNALRDDVIKLHEQTNNLSQVNNLVDTFMAQQVQTHEKGIMGVVQTVARNGFGLNLSDEETQQLVTDLMAQGIDSWSKLFAFATTAVNENLSTILDNRSEAANFFTDLLTELNKDSDYIGSQTINATREWIAGIGASDTTVTAANNGVKDLLNSFVDGNVQGRAFDGYISGATVFIDTNQDGVLTPGEINTTTDALGHFLFEGNLPDGRLVLTGGIDIATNQPFIGTLSEPDGAFKLSPLTTLVNQLLQNGQAENIVAAEDIIFQTLEIPRVDLSSFDPIEIGLNPNTSTQAQNAALQLQAITAQILNVLSVSSTLIDNVAVATGDATHSMTNSLLEVLVSGAQNELIVDLADLLTLKNIITTGAANSGIVGNIETPVSQIASVLAEINTITQQAAENSNTDTQTAFSNIVKFQTLLQAQVIPKAVAALETGDLSAVVTEFTNDNLVKNIDEVVLTGTLNENTPVNDGDDGTNNSGNPTNPPTTTTTPLPPPPADTPPTLSISTPADDATAVAVNSNIVLTFNESVVAGTGNIVINDGTDTRTIDVTDGTQVSFSGSNVTINPTTDLNPKTTYNVQMASGVIEDAASNAYAGISDATTLNFSTPDTNAPTLGSSTPADDATTAAVGSNIVLTFNESVVAGTGNIVISDGGDTRTIDVTDGTQVSFSGSNVTINPTTDLNPNTTYNVQMVSGVIEDAASNAYAGITNSTTLNFSTPDTNAPTLDSSTPADDATAVAVGSNIVLTFSESVVTGTGNIVISDGTDTRTIDVTDGTQVSFSDKTVTINPMADLNADTIYNVQMASGVIEDSSGNAYTGISDNSALNIDTTVQIELSAIEQSNNNGGFVINGVGADDRSGISVSNAGDVNGDGFADLIVGAYRDGPNGSSSGASFVVFGKTNGTVVELSDVEGGTGGFVINGISSGDQSGLSVSNAGDVNGDGLADLIVGARYDDPNGSNSGASFVIFGKTNVTAVELSDIESGTGGFAINGVSIGDLSGRSVSNAGDVNGDGLADLIISAYRDDPNGSISGASFVVFGKKNGTAVELSEIDAGNGGFVINGVGAGDFSGRSVSNAGDVNGDGLADLIIGAYRDDSNGTYSGTSFAVFGKTNSTAVELSDIEGGTGGFVINGVSTGDYSGLSVSSAGDVNGDGFADLIVGARRDDPNESESGASFVVFGKTNGTVVELSNIEAGNGGFAINGINANDQSGFSVSSAGDVNGDGLTDLIVGARYDDPNGVSNSGASFVVFGKTNGTTVELSDIDTGTGGFVINGVSASDNSGFSVSGAGDVNGDGLADLIVGARFDDPNGADSGSSFVIFGGQGSTATVGSSGNDTLTGDDNANQLVAGAGNDTLVGNGGADVLRGGAGDDILAVSDLTFASLDGGTGSDTLRFDAALSLDLRTLSDPKLDSIEVIDLTGDGGNSTLSLNLTDVLNLNEAQTSANTLVINGNAGDIVNLDDTSNGQTGSWADSGGSVYQFTVGGIGVIGTVTIDAAVTVNIV